MRPPRRRTEPPRSAGCAAGRHVAEQRAIPLGERVDGDVEVLVAEDVELLSRHMPRDEGCKRAGRLTQVDDAGPHRCDRERSLDTDPPQPVEDQRRGSARRPPRAAPEPLAFERDRLVRAERACPLEARLVAPDADDAACAEHLHGLDRDGTDRPRRTEDEHALSSRTHGSPPGGRKPPRDPRHAERGRDDVVDSVRHLDQDRIGHGEALGERPVARPGAAAARRVDPRARGEARRPQHGADRLDAGHVRRAAAGNLPAAMFTSIGLSPAARSSTRASPSAGLGSGCSPTTGSAFSSLMMIARMDTSRFGEIRCVDGRIRSAPPRLRAPGRRLP